MKGTHSISSHSCPITLQSGQLNPHPTPTTELLDPRLRIATQGQGLMKHLDWCFSPSELINQSICILLRSICNPSHPRHQHPGPPGLVTSLLPWLWLPSWTLHTSSTQQPEQPCQNGAMPGDFFAQHLPAACRGKAKY